MRPWLTVPGIWDSRAVLVCAPACSALSVFSLHLVIMNMKVQHLEVRNQAAVRAWGKHMDDELTGSPCLGVHSAFKATDRHSWLTVIPSYTVSLPHTGT